MAQRVGEVRLPGGVMPMGTAVAVNPADTLAQNLRILAANPRDVQALTQAGLSAIEVGDPNAALGFLGRAEQLSPSNGYVKAALGSALVNLERGAEAMAFFRQAMSLGVPETQFAKDRGLAYDLAGDPRQAQRDYLLALRNGPDAETTRRLALSYGITGDRDQALKLLDPLVQRQDQGAWRARAFVLAMAGDQRGAERIVQQVMPVGMGSTMTSFMRQLPALNASARAHAVNFGTIPSTSPIFAAAVPLEPLRPISGAMADSLTREEAPVAVLAMESNEGRRKNSKAKRRRPGRDDDLLAATPPSVASVASEPAASLGGSRMAALETDRRPSTRVETDTRLRSTSGTAVAKAQESAPARGETLADATARIAAVRDEALKGAGKPPSAVFEIPSTAAVTSPPVAVLAPAPVRVQAPIIASVGAPIMPPVVKTPDPAPAPARVAVAPPVPQSIAPQIALPPPSPAPMPTVTLAPSEPVKAPPPISGPVATAPVPQAGFSPAVMGDVVPPPAAAPAPSPTPTPAQVAPPPTVVQPAPPPAAITTPAPLPSQQAGLVSTGPRPLMGPPAPEGLNPSAPVPTPVDPVAEPVSTIVAQAPVQAEVVPQGTAPSEDVGLNGLLDDLAPEQERAAGAVLGDAEFRKARAAAKRKADADAKVKAAEEVELAKKKEEEEAKKRELAKSPPRVWVQVATGNAKSGITSTMRKVREQAGDTLSRYGSATVPYKATNRLLVGPFASEAEARKAVNALSKKGVQATTFTSAAGQDVAKLASK